MDIAVIHLEPAQTADFEGGILRVEVVLRAFGQPKEAHEWAIRLDPGDDTASTANPVTELLQVVSGATLAAWQNEEIERLSDICDVYGYSLPGAADVLEISLLSRILVTTVKETGLREVAEALSVPGIQAANPDFGASLVSELLDHLFARAVNLPYLTLQQVTGLAGMISPSMANWFGDAADQRYAAFGAALPDGCDVINQLAFSSPNASLEETTDEATGGTEATDPNLLFASDSPLRNILPGFEVRHGQLQMVEAVQAALDGDEHLIVEAGTGTGKSLAYLIPAAIYAKKHDTRVIVSTHTIALQDQIEMRDFPMMKEALPMPLSLTVFKGRTHYVCMRKVLQEVRNANLATPREDVESYMTLLTWLVGTAHGNREELPLRGRLSDVWVRVQSETETCINKRCPFFKPCYYFRARARAYEADVIVTNHSLVFSDLKADHRVLPRYDKLILDEAHHLEDQATKHLGDEVHWFQCLALLGRLSRDNARHGVVPELLSKLTGSDARSTTVVPALEGMVENLRSLRMSMDDAFTTLAQLIPQGQTDVRLTPSMESSSLWLRYLTLCDDMTSVVQSLENQAASLTDAAELEPDEDLAGRLFDAAGFLQELFGHVHILCNAGDFSEDWVGWIESGGRDGRQISLHRAPVDVAQILRDTLFDTKSSVVLTSATLSVDGKFEYPVERLGLDQARRDQRLRTLTVPSPFQLDRQALLCVPTDVPELAKMSAEEAATWMSDSLYQLAKISQGRLLALFTSHAMLRATSEHLRQPLANSGLTLYAQGVDGSRTHLLDMFRKHPNSVLLGAQSFWEGIDLPGDQLTTLVIVRLPFAPPTHPVTQARHERLEARGMSAFAHASLPEAVVRFRQGFGRLIRTVQDRGVVVVYDKRIVTQRYGTSFVRSLGGGKPFVGKEQDVMAQVKRFLTSTT